MMKLLLVTLLAQAALGAWVDVEEWAKFKQNHGKEYESTLVELQRMKTYGANKAYIARHNAEADAGKHSYWLAVNKYADLTHDQFRAQMLGHKKPSSRSTGTPFQSSGLKAPESKDWRDEGAVTQVKDQGQCGSCWAFSTTGTLEGQWKLAGNDMVELSEQQLMDCSGSYGNLACQGGEMYTAMQYVVDNGGIMSEADYPYETKTHLRRCLWDASKVAAKAKSFTRIDTEVESDLEEAVGTVGPVSVAMDASHFDFQLYSHGIYHNPNCMTANADLDHGVLAVGYGEEADGKYWIVKNSWGPSWGEEGFFKMTRDGSNMCGIATDCMYPAV